MSSKDPAAQELADAAAVYAAREEIIRALGPLAASPLDERAADGMRAALERVQSPAVRRAVRRLKRPASDSRPHLFSLPGGAERAGRSSSDGSPGPPLMRTALRVGVAGGAA